MTPLKIQVHIDKEDFKRKLGVKDGEPGKDADEGRMTKTILEYVKGALPTKDSILALIKPLIPPAKPGKDGSPDSGEAIIGKVNKDRSAKKIRKEKVEGLLELEIAVKTAATNVQNVARFIGQTAQIYNLSPLLDGVTKTFTLPQHTLILGIHFSSRPFIANPATDYTRTAKSITFTSEIDATQTLATGQTCVIEYTNP